MLDSFIDDQGDEAADVEAAQLLQGLRSQDRVFADSDAGTPQAAAAAGAAAAAMVAGAAAVPLPRKRGRPLGSKGKSENPADWDPKEVSVTITGGSRDIDPGKLDDMEAFLREYCMAGMFALERGGTVSHLHLQVGLFPAHDAIRKVATCV